MTVPSSKLVFAGAAGLLLLIAFGFDIAELKKLFSGLTTAEHDVLQLKANQFRIHMLELRVDEILARLEEGCSNATFATEIHEEVKEIRQEVVQLRGSAQEGEKVTVTSDGGETTDNSTAPANDARSTATPEQGNEVAVADASTSTTPQSADTAAEEGARTYAKEADPNIFDPKLTLEDYEFLEHSWPTEDWIRGCTSALKNDTDIVKPFPTDRPGYALGDCIKLCNKCGYGLKKGESAMATMGGYYGLRACSYGKKDIKNLTIVDELFDRFGQQEGYRKPDPETIVLHLRLGDVIEYSGKSADYLLRNGGIPRHPAFGRAKKKAIRSMEEYLTDLTNENATKVFIMGGSHKPELYETSRVYANCLQRGFAKAGLKVDMDLDSGEADQDFYFMSHAKRIMVSTGGYSRFIGQMARRTGGRTVGPVF